MLWSIGLFVLVFVASLASIAALIQVLPTRYFVDDHPFWHGQAPLVRGLGLVAKNVLGLAIVGLGIVLSIPGIPGQGLLTILVGLVLLDIPGKRKLLLKLASQRKVLRAMNALRRKYGKPPLKVK